MDTDSLRLFVLAAEKLNIGSAGRNLGLVPSIASTRLAKLERSVGAILLHRSTRRVVLSQAGAEFLPYARDIIASKDAARVAMGQEKAQLSGTLRFTAPSTFAQQYIAPILPDFLTDHPGLRMDLHLSDRQADLIEGSFDLALRNSRLEDSTLKGRKLANDKRVLCAAPQYLEEHGNPKTPEDLRRHRFVAFGDSSALTLASDSGDRTVFDPTSSKCNLIIDEGLSHKIATVAGSGISANSTWSVYEELSQGRLVRVLPKFRVAEETALWLIYPEANVLSAKVRVFMDFLLNRIGRNPPWTNKAY